MRLPTSIATTDKDSVTVRDLDLTEDIVGEMDFGSFYYLLLTGEVPTESERRLFNAMLISIAEHGITPSVIAARLTYDSAPEAIQGAVASGLLGAGKTFLGSMEDVTTMLQAGADRVDDGAELESVATEIVDEYDRLPGVGHPEHEPEDPRAVKLFSLLEEEGLSSQQAELMFAIRDAAERRYEIDLPINVTGAIGTVIAEMDLDPMVARGIALVARSAGLVGHLAEEKERPIARDIWELVLEDVEYEGTAPDGE